MKHVHRLLAWPLILVCGLAAQVSRRQETQHTSATRNDVSFETAARVVEPACILSQLMARRRFNAARNSTPAAVMDGPNTTCRYLSLSNLHALVVPTAHLVFAYIDFLFSEGSNPGNHSTLLLSQELPMRYTCTTKRLRGAAVGVSGQALRWKCSLNEPLSAPHIQYGKVSKQALWVAIAGCRVQDTCLELLQLWQRGCHQEHVGIGQVAKRLDV